MGKQFKEMRCLLSLIISLTAPLFLWGQSSSVELYTIPRSEGPLEIRIGYSILNISNINEKEETIQFDGALFLRWKDERLKYTPADSTYSGKNNLRVPEKVYQGIYSINRLYKGWRPQLYFLNGVGNKDVNTQTIAIWPDGTVQYTEGFIAEMGTPMDLRSYPFDTQDLLLYMHPTPYTEDELVFVPDKSLSKTWVQNLGTAEWDRKAEEMAVTTAEIQAHDGSVIPVSEFVIALKIKRKPLHILFSIILPMVLLVSLTWIVFWLDKNPVIDRINILFIGILSVVAFYMVIQDNIPRIDYLTLMDFFVLENFVILAASVLVSLALDRMKHSGKTARAQKLHRICRWAFPAGYVLTALIIFLIFS